MLFVILLLLILLFTGQWIAFTLGSIATLCFLALGGKEVMVPMIYFGKIVNFHFLAMPLFILMGEIFLLSGIGTEIFDKLYSAFRRIKLKGGLLYVLIIGNAFFGAISGSSIAAIGALGPSIVPELNRKGYKKGVSLGTLTTAGILAVMIPPSSGLIFYGIIAEQSISKLFIATIIPGILLTIFLILTVWIWIKLDPTTIISESTGVKEQEITSNLWLFMKDVFSLWPFALLALVVLGSIYTGICTATESAAIGVVGTIFISILKRKFSWELIWKSFLQTVNVTGIMGLLIGGAMAFSYVFTNFGLASLLNDYLNSLPGPSWCKMLQIIGIYFILGLFMDPPAMTILTVPLFLPFVISLGYDPIWFGIVQTICCEIGVLTPPVGANLYMTQAVTGEDLSLIVKGTIPYWITCLIFTIFWSFSHN